MDTPLLNGLNESFRIWIEADTNGQKDIVAEIAPLARALRDRAMKDLGREEVTYQTGPDGKRLHLLIG